MGHTDCTVLQCLYSTDIPLHPYAPYGLYRASVPVQYILNYTASMGPTFCKVTQNLYSTPKLITNYGPYNLYRTLGPVQ